MIVFDDNARVASTSPKVLSNAFIISIAIVMNSVAN